MLMNKKHPLLTLLSPRFQRWAITILLFIIAILPRITHPISRPLNWQERSFHFINAVIEQNWEGTYLQYHPATTVMWLSGIGTKVFTLNHNNFTVEHLLGMTPVKPGILNGALMASVLPLAIVIAFCISLTYPLLLQLVSKKIALAGSIFLALDPFYIGYSKVVHPNALLAAFMFISALFLLVYLRHERLLNLIWSGFFAGLALLTKSPAIFLIPFTLLIVTLARFSPIFANKPEWGKWREWIRPFPHIARTLIIWSIVVAVTYFILWPAMWVKPLTVLGWVFDGIVRHTENIHGNPLYFNGVSTIQDPGILFYLATLVWKTTLITLPLIVISLLWTPFRLKTEEGQVALAFIIYTAFFTIQMSLGNFKQTAYILPAVPGLSMLAAIGLGWSAELWLRIKRWHRRTVVSTIYVTLLFMIQIGIVLSLDPYYGTHFNELLGGTQTAQQILPLQDEGEGLDLAGKFLNQLPHGQNKTASVYIRNASVFKREFSGRVISTIEPWVSYRVYDVNQIMRGLGDETWQEAWQADRETEPLYTVSFDGVTYVWVYGDLPTKPAPDGPEFNDEYRLGDHIWLRKVRLNAATLQAGDTLTVVLYWETDGAVEEDLTVFTHLLSSEQELIAQHDSVPLSGIRPTYTWIEGELLEDTRFIYLDENLPPGDYKLSVGLYDSETIERLPAYATSGEVLPENRIVIGTINIENDQ